MPRLALLSRLASDRRLVLAAGCVVGPNYARPPVPTPAAVSLRGRTRAGADARRFAVVRGVRRSAAAGADPRRHRQQPRFADGGGARAGGARPGRHREVLSSIRKSTPRPIPALRQASTTKRPIRRPARRHDARQRHLWVPAVVGDRSVRPPASSVGSGAGRWRSPASRGAAACWSRSSATSPRTTSCSASWICSSISRSRMSSWRRRRPA